MSLGFSCVGDVLRGVLVVVIVHVSGNCQWEFCWARGVFQKMLVGDFFGVVFFRGHRCIVFCSGVTSFLGGRGICLWNTCLWTYLCGRLLQCLKHSFFCPYREGHFSFHGLFDRSRCSGPRVDR